MSLQHIQKNSPKLLPKPAKFEKNPPNGYRVIRKTKCGAGGAGGAGSSPIHKQASLAGRLKINSKENHFMAKRKGITKMFLLLGIFNQEEINIPLCEFPNSAGIVYR